MIFAWICEDSCVFYIICVHYIRNTHMGCKTLRNPITITTQKPYLRKDGFIDLAFFVTLTKRRKYQLFDCTYICLCCNIVLTILKNCQNLSQGTTNVVLLGRECNLNSNVMVRYIQFTSANVTFFFFFLNNLCYFDLSVYICW